MTPYVAPTDEFVDLMCDLAEDRLSPDDIDRLNVLLCADPRNCQHYVDFMAILTRLSWVGDDETSDAEDREEGYLAQRAMMPWNAARMPHSSRPAAKI